jgi:dihydrodipicolinate synthase/N-acetylneuraminate lyase
MDSSRAAASVQSSKPKYELRGVVVSLNTPFDDRGKIDFQSYGRLIEHQLKEGAVGFLAPAQAGEVNELTRAERIELIRFVHERSAGRGVFFACATSADERESLALAEAAVAAGCHAVLAEPPAGRKGDREAVKEFFRTMGSLQMPVLAIQDLEWNGPGLPIEDIVEMFETIEAFRCLKVEVQPAGPKCTAVLEATGGRMHVSGGWAANQLIESLDRGADVYMSTAMTALYTKVMRLHASGEREAALEVFHRMLPVLAFTRQHLDVSIHFHKRQMAHLGLFATTYVRKQGQRYDRFHERYGQELIEYLDRIEHEEQSA